MRRLGCQRCGRTSGSFFDSRCWKLACGPSPEPLFYLSGDLRMRGFWMGSILTAVAVFGVLLPGVYARRRSGQCRKGARAEG